MNPLASILADHIPDGFRLEIRESDEFNWTSFRYTRLSDETWCQEVVSNVLIERAILLEALADLVLIQVADKFAEADRLVDESWRCRQ